MSLGQKCLLIAFSFCMFACHEHEEVDNKIYLVSHPAVLKREVNFCNEKMKISKGFSAHCQLIAVALSEYTTLTSQRQRDPQGFGTRIIHLQMQKSLTKSESAELASMLAVVAASGPN